jgi:large subunit ribosomal protein L3
MNQYPGVFGRKLGMTQVISEDGTVLPCTVIEANATVVGKRTKERDGYDALILGLDDAKEKHVSKAVLGTFKQANVAPKRRLRELRCTAEHAASVEVGAVVALDQIFSEGQIVDVRGVSRGRGFSGVMRRHHFAGGVATHGTHEYKRHGGSIGTNMTPGRTFKGLRMPGQCGNWNISILNQRVIKVIPEKHLLLIRGAVPGAANGLVEVRGAVKRRGGKKAS